MYVRSLFPDRVVFRAHFVMRLWEKERHEVGDGAGKRSVHDTIRGRRFWVSSKGTLAWLTTFIRR